jgi:hypothetical protein
MGSEFRSLKDLWGPSHSHGKRRSHHELYRYHKDLAEKHKHLGFKGLARRVSHEYLLKGYSKARAEKIGKETAAKVYRERGRR